MKIGINLEGFSGVEVDTTPATRGPGLAPMAPDHREGTPVDFDALQTGPRHRPLPPMADDAARASADHFRSQTTDANRAAWVASLRAHGHLVAGLLRGAALGVVGDETALCVRCGRFCTGDPSPGMGSVSERHARYSGPARTTDCSRSLAELSGWPSWWQAPHGREVLAATFRASWPHEAFAGHLLRKYCLREGLDVPALGDRLGLAGEEPYYNERAGTWAIPAPERGPVVMLMHLLPADPDGFLTAGESAGISTQLLTRTMGIVEEVR